MKNRSITDAQVYEVDIVCDLSQKALDVLEEYLYITLTFQIVNFMSINDDEAQSKGWCLTWHHE